MQISACCRPDPAMAVGSQRGFTLMEILIVMAVMALMVAIVGPNLPRLANRVEASTERETVHDEISGLAYRAYVLGQSFTLDAESGHRLLEDGRPLLDIPAGWSVYADPPLVHYGFNGYCSGGKLRLLAPDGSIEHVTLSPPFCRLDGHGQG